MTDGTADEEASSAQDVNAAHIRLLVQGLRTGEDPDKGAEIESLPGPAQLEAQDHQQDITLKKQYAYWLLGAVVGQLLIADIVFIVYAWEGKGWDLDAVVIDVWLAATLIQVIGVVTIVTRYLFPRRDSAGLGDG